MATKKVAQGGRASEALGQKSVSDEIHRAAKRAGIRGATMPAGKQHCLMARTDIEQLDKLLSYAVDSAIEAAPREIPPLHGRTGAEAAVDACRAIRKVRDAFAKAIEGAS